MPYFTLATRDSENSAFTVQFGDYDRSTVKQEMLDSYSSFKRMNCIIIKTDTANQSAIDHAIARANGFTLRIEAESDYHSLDLLVKPDADLDGTFRAFCMHERKYLNVNGWLFSISYE